ncbi:MAG TPA: BrnA antitoxin family protein [Thermoanaerobaculia bacterium]|nr:BrnA antitoxin family protein [Thermoanaerobaculia bacterium]
MKKEYDFSAGKRGAVVPIPPGKSRITIRLDDDLLEWFKEQVHAAGGGNYQTLINAALREHVHQKKEPLEETLRRVVRTELEAKLPAANEGTRPAAVGGRRR